MINNFEDKTFDQLKSMRNSWNLKKVHDNNLFEAWAIRMIDILLEKIERLENDNK